LDNYIERTERTLKLFFICIGAILLLLAIWFIPSWQANSFRGRIDSESIAKLEPKDRVQLDLDLIAEENRSRLTLAQIIGGLVLLSGLYLTWRNIKVNEEGKLTDRFSKAVELLGSEYLDGRLGGIYALERIAKDSQKDHWTVMEVLTAFVREQSRKSSDGKKSDKISPDIQAALTVIARRKWYLEETKDQQIDLSGSYLPQANLKAANLRNANLSKATLNSANFSGANLINVNLTDANLDEGDLRSAHLNDNNIVIAHRSGAIFENADLKRAILGSMTGLYSPDLRLYGAQDKEVVESHIDTPVGNFICYNNGTFLDVTNNLMWIQAFWGMKYDGKRFKCQPVNLNWLEATRLFGYGGVIPITAGLRAEDIKENNNDYRSGRCSVHFAESIDWRLPTAKEILTLSFCTRGHEGDNNYDGYRFFEDEKSKALRKKLFPDCAYLYTAWSANENGEYAWCLDGHDNLGDYKKNEDKPVLLVRTNK
jgi:hypothetical protein